VAPSSVWVGGIEVTPVLDAVGRLGGLAELYPETPSEAWAPYRTLYPELFVDDEWLLPCGCFLVRSAETTILVDTGVGPPGLWDWEAESEGGLPAGLESQGVGRDDVDVVVLTHLHIDHVGWNTDRDGTVFFPRARYLVHREALAFARTQDERPHVQRCVVPLLDRFEHLAPGAEIAPGVAVLELPGHYPGHAGLRVTSGGRRLDLIADMAVHPALLQEPEWVYVSDGDPARCAGTRRAVVPELLDRDVLVACGHYPGAGIGRIVTRSGRPVWVEAEA